MWKTRRRTERGDTPKIFIRPKPYNEHVRFHNFLKHVRGMPG